MYLLNGQKIDINGWNTAPNGDQLPPGFLSDPDARQRYGVTEVSDPVWPDSRFFNTVQNVDGSLTSTQRAIADIQSDFINQLASIRYQKETGGVTIPGGYTIDTSRESQAQIVALDQAIRAGYLTSTSFKTSTGQWIPIDGPTASASAKMVVEYVQACFSHEKDMTSTIKAADFAGLQAIDLNSGWPSSVLTS